LLDANEDFLRSTCNTLGHETIRHIFYEDFKEIVISHIKKAEKEFALINDSDYRDFLCYFYVDALLGTLSDYVKNRKDRNRNQIVSYLIYTFRNSMSGIINGQASQVIPDINGEKS